MIQKDVKQQIIADYKLSENDTGSPEVQIAILTNRINSLNEHLKAKGINSVNVNRDIEK